jgi:hypothetical protein
MLNGAHKLAMQKERRQLQALIEREKQLRREGEVSGADAVQREVIARFHEYNLASKAARPVKLMTDRELYSSLKSQLSTLSANARHREAGACWRKMVEIEKRLKVAARARRGEVVLLSRPGS